MQRLFEHTVLRGLLTNRPDVLREADALARQNGFTEEMLIQCQNNVLTWLRHHSVTPLHAHELKAIVKLQSVIRTWLIRKRLYIKFTMLMNLAKNGSTLYLHDARVYESIINKNRKRM